MLQKLSVPVFAAALLLTGITLAQPDEVTPQNPVPLLSRLYNHIGDPKLTEKLKLTQEQLKKFEDRRKKSLEEYRNTQPTEYSKASAERMKAQLAFMKNTLTPAQQARSTQLMAQSALGLARPARFSEPIECMVPSRITRVNAKLLSVFPEIAEALQLSAEQKKVVEEVAKALAFGRPEFDFIPGRMCSGVPALLRNCV